MKDQALLEKKPLVDAFLEQGPRPLSSFSFISIFAWCDFFDFEFKMLNDCLGIFAHGSLGCFLYLPPLGKALDAAVIEEAFAHMARRGVGVANRIENIPENLLPVFGQSGYNQFSKSPEYVYRREDLAELKGNAYKSRRHDCNVFLGRQVAHSFGPYTDDDFSFCMGLYERWAAGRAEANGDGVYRSMLEENRLVHGRLLKFWRPLGLVARVLKAEGKVTGYTFGFPVDEQTFCVYAEITDAGVPGAASYIFKSFCADAGLRSFSRINAMDDFAMPHVARAKRSWRPKELVPSYAVSRATPALHRGGLKGKTIDAHQTC